MIFLILYERSTLMEQPRQKRREPREYDEKEDDTQFGNQKRKHGFTAIGACTFPDMHAWPPRRPDCIARVSEGRSSAEGSSHSPCRTPG